MANPRRVQAFFNTITFSKTTSIFCLFFLELDPGNAIFGFLAKNYIGYTDSRPNWRQESLFYGFQTKLYFRVKIYFSYKTYFR